VSVQLASNSNARGKSCLTDTSGSFQTSTGPERTANNHGGGGNQWVRSPEVNRGCQQTLFSHLIIPPPAKRHQ